MKKSTLLRGRLFILISLLVLINISCKMPIDQGKNTTNGTQNSAQLDNESEDIQEEVIGQELLDLEAEYAEMLAPIISLKKTKTKIYWFIVSWLKTAYSTPDWTGYYSKEWKATAKQNGIDCSGFSRVMLDQIFDKQVSGGSQRLLDYHSTRVQLNDLKMGDLVFFRAPYATNDKIVHVGVYLQDNYFVHATSTKSAASGYGLKVSSLKEEDWAKEFVTGGKVKD